MTTKAVFAAFLAAHGRPFSQSFVDQLVERKAAAYFEHIKERPIIFPGVRERVQEATMTRRLAVCSGALRQEIESYLRVGRHPQRIRAHHQRGRCLAGQTGPEAFLHALAGLNRHGPESLTPDHCLVIEDSLPGIRGARSAGMKVLAVANTHALR